MTKLYNQTQSKIKKGASSLFAPAKPAGESPLKNVIIKQEVTSEEEDSILGTPGSLSSSIASTKGK